MGYHFRCVPSVTSGRLATGSARPCRHSKVLWSTAVVTLGCTLTFDAGCQTHYRNSLNLVVHKKKILWCIYKSHSIDCGSQNNGKLHCFACKSHYSNCVWCITQIRFVSQLRDLFNKQNLFKKLKEIDEPLYILHTYTWASNLYFLWVYYVNLITFQIPREGRNRNPDPQIFISN